MACNWTLLLKRERICIIETLIVVLVIIVNVRKSRPDPIRFLMKKSNMHSFLYRCLPFSLCFERFPFALRSARKFLLYRSQFLILCFQNELPRFRRFYLKIRNVHEGYILQYFTCAMCFLTFIDFIFKNVQFLWISRHSRIFCSFDILSKFYTSNLVECIFISSKSFFTCLKWLPLISS